MTEPQYDQRVVPIDALVPNEWNPQAQDDATFNELVNQIREVGFVEVPTVVDLEDGTFRIIGGEHRWRAAQVVGLKEIPVLVLPLEDWDEDLQKFQTVRLNVLKGNLSPEKFLPLYNEMADKYGKDAMQKLFAFTDKKALENAIGKMREGVKKTLPENLQKEFEEKSRDARTMDDLEKIIHEIFNKHGDTCNLSYMVFTFGKAEHYYIAMDQDMRRAMHRVVEFCEFTQTDINDFLAPIIAQAGVDAKMALANASPAAPEVEEEDVEF